MCTGSRGVQRPQVAWCNSAGEHRDPATPVAGPVEAAAVGFGVPCDSASGIECGKYHARGGAYLEVLVVYYDSWWITWSS